MVARTTVCGLSASLSSNVWTDVPGAQPAADEEWSVATLVISTNTAANLEFRLTDGVNSFSFGVYGSTATASEAAPLRGLKIPSGYKLQVQRVGTTGNATIGVSATTRSTA